MKTEFMSQACELPVSLVQDQPANGTESDAQRVSDVIHQASWSRDQDVDAFTQPEEKQQEILNMAPTWVLQHHLQLKLHVSEQKTHQDAVCSVMRAAACGGH